MRVLIFGLPGSGKTYLAERLVEYLGDNVDWFNADKVREEANDWDFSEEGRLRQNKRMLSLCENAEAEGKIANWLSVNGGVVLDLEGDSDPTVSVGVAYDITETGSIDLGYSEIKSTSSTAVTSRLSGWSLGYKMSF